MQRALIGMRRGDFEKFLFLRCGRKRRLAVGGGGSDEGADGTTTMLQPTLTQKMVEMLALVKNSQTKGMDQAIQEVATKCRCQPQVRTRKLVCDYFLYSLLISLVSCDLFVQ